MNTTLTRFLEKLRLRLEASADGVVEPFKRESVPVPSFVLYFQDPKFKFRRWTDNDDDMLLEHRALVSKWKDRLYLKAPLTYERDVIAFAHFIQLAILRDWPYYPAGRARRRAFFDRIAPLEPKDPRFLDANIVLFQFLFDHQEITSLCTLFPWFQTEDEILARNEAEARKTLDKEGAN